MAERKVTVFTGADGNDYDVRDEAAQQSIETISNGIGSVPSGQTVEGQISALESGKVPTTRKVNNKALSSDITLFGTDIPVSSSDNTKVDSALASKVPNTRKVNNKALSSDVNLVGSDIPVSALDSTKLDVAITDLKSAILLQEETIPDTTQTISFDSSGNVSSIVHKDGSNNTIRSDAFTFGTNTITEVRTLYTGETLTIVTNTITLVTTVTYAAA